MKLLISFLLALTASCGKVEVSSDTKLSTFRSIAPEIIRPGTAEFNELKEVCDSIQAKTVTLDALLSTNFLFSNTSKECSAPEFSGMEDSNVTLVNQNGSFKFNEGANQFYFADVETSRDGVLGQICSQLSSTTPLASPLAQEASSLIYFSTRSFAATDCSANVYERCIKIEKASRDTSDNKVRGRVHTIEWIKIKLNEPRRGFFTYKKRVSEASCVPGNFLGRTATLK